MTTAKDYDENLKLLFSSLFARKMPYVIFAHADEDDAMIFTNISLDDIMLYEPNTDKYIHTVLLKDRSFLDWIYETFPILKEHKCILDVRQFMTALNKSSDKYSSAKLELCDNSITITTTNGTIPCGSVIDDEIVTAYMKIFSGISSTGLWSESKKLSPSEVGKDFSIIEVVLDDSNVYNKENLLYKTILEPGKNVPSVAEYCKKTKEPCFIKLMVNKQNSAIRVKYVCISDSIYVESICPAMFWFPSNIVELNKEV